MIRERGETFLQAQEQTDHRLQERIQEKILLNRRWKALTAEPHDPFFGDFYNFYSWAMESGYSVGMKLVKTVDSLPWGPDNCKWRSMGDDKGLATAYVQDFITRWDKTVNVLRVYFGLEPFPVEVEENEQ